MKKVILLILCLFLTACSGNKDQFAAYRKNTAAQIFHHAEASMAKGDYGKAAEGFEALDAIYPFGPYSQQAQLDVIYVYYMSNNSPSAMAAADRYIRLYPRGNNIAYAYYMKGIISQAAGYSWLQRKIGVDPSWRDLKFQKRALRAFSEVATMYPRSPYTPDSILRMRYLRNVLARKSVELSQFYYKRHAYVAAANRASYVVKHYNKTVEVPDALDLMLKSYRRMGI